MGLAPDEQRSLWACMLMESAPEIHFPNATVPNRRGVIRSVAIGVEYFTPFEEGQMLCKLLHRQLAHKLVEKFIAGKAFGRSPGILGAERWARPAGKKDDGESARDPHVPRIFGSCPCSATHCNRDDLALPFSLRPASRRPTPSHKRRASATCPDRRRGRVLMTALTGSMRKGRHI